MTQAVLSAGSKIGIGDGASPEVFNQIIEATTFGFPETTNDEVEVTSLDSTRKEFISGLSDGGSVTIEGNWIAGDTYHQALKTAAENKTQTSLLIELADGTDVEFVVAPSAFAINVEPNSALTFSFTGKVSGTPDSSPTSTIV